MFYFLNLLWIRKFPTYNKLSYEDMDYMVIVS
jgi:hypothetical protein